MTDKTDALREAAETMRAVREKCPWSQQITHRDLVPYLIEESHEVIDAVEDGTRADLREELGDLLWQVLFHSAIAAQDPDDPFDIDDVAQTLTEKMVRRHPHVFADAVARTPEEVLVHWNAAKSAEKRERKSVLDGVPRGMPALALAQKLVGRAASVGVSLPEPAGSLSEPAGSLPEPAGSLSEPTGSLPEPAGSLSEPTGSLPEPAGSLSEPTGSLPEPAGSLSEPAGSLPEPVEGSNTHAPASESELGDALLTLVSRARDSGWDAERALRERLRRFEDEVRAAEV